MNNSIQTFKRPTRLPASTVNKGPDQFQHAALRREHQRELAIDEALAESFPASDPPAWNPGLARPVPVDVPVTHARVELGTRAGALRELTHRVEAEYSEMPGLSLTLFQAQRLWAIDRQRCESVFSALVAHGFLRMTTKGRFVRC